MIQTSMSELEWYRARERMGDDEARERLANVRRRLDAKPPRGRRLFLADARDVAALVMLIDWADEEAREAGDAAPDAGGMQANICITRLVAALHEIAPGHPLLEELPFCQCVPEPLPPESDCNNASRAVDPRTS